MSIDSTRSDLPLRCALLLAGILGISAIGGWVSAASGASPFTDLASTPRANLARAANADAFAAIARRARPALLAHLDEESVPAAENPGAPALGGSAASTDPGPSADWERVPAAAESPPQSPASPPLDATNGGASPVNARSAATATPGGDATAAASPPGRPSNAGSGGSSSEVTVNTATAQVPAKAPIPGASNGAGALAGEQHADLEPPPALDLATIQSGPDLSRVSLADEIKKADTPARSAALRVTEQARLELAAGQIDEALRNLGRAVSIDPGNPFGYFSLGRVYLVRRNYTQALTFFQRAEIGFAARPDWLGETVGLEGVCYEELGRMTDAAMAYRRALVSASGNLRARVGYSRLSGYLPTTATADASASGASASEALPPPERTAAGPAPAEAPPPPPPAANMPDSARKVPVVHDQTNQPDHDNQTD